MYRWLNSYSVIACGNFFAQFQFLLTLSIVINLLNQLYRPIVDRRSPFTPKDSQPLLLQAVLGARDESDIQIIRMILHYSGDIINIPDPIAKRTPLHVVALTGYYELAE